MAALEAHVLRGFVLILWTLRGIWEKIVVPVEGHAGCFVSMPCV